MIRLSQKFSPRRRPLSRGCGWPKFNQLEMVTIHLQTQFDEDRCMQLRVIVVTGPSTNPQTNTQTGPITIHCAAA